MQRKCSTANAIMLALGAYGEGSLIVNDIFACSDVIAIGAIRPLIRHGIRVPEDVSAVGYDAVTMARYGRPALTTVHQALARAGRLMVSKLLCAKSGRSIVSERLDTDITVRVSCGA